MILPRARVAFAAAILVFPAVVAFFQIIDPALSHSLTGIGHTVVDAFSSVGQVIADALSWHHLKNTFSIATVVIQPLAVKTRDAWVMLGCSNAHGYVLIKKGEIDSYLEGRVRKVTVASIKSYIERKLAAAKKDTAPVRTEKATAASVAARAERKAVEGKPIVPIANAKKRAPKPVRKELPPPAPIATGEATPAVKMAQHAAGVEPPRRGRARKSVPIAAEEATPQT
jgi:hypothetical protein